MAGANVAIPSLFLAALYLSSFTEIRVDGQADVANFTRSGNEMLFKCKRDVWLDHMNQPGDAYLLSSVLGQTPLHCAQQCFEDVTTPNACSSFSFDAGNCTMFWTTFTADTSLVAAVGKQYCFASEN